MEELTKASLESMIDMQHQLFSNEFIDKVILTQQGPTMQLKGISDENFYLLMHELFGEEEVVYQNQVDGKYAYFEGNGCLFINKPDGEGEVSSDTFRNTFNLFYKICSTFNDTFTMFKDLLDFGAYSMVHDLTSYKPSIFKRIKGEKSELGLLDQLGVRCKDRDMGIEFKYNGMLVYM